MTERLYISTGVYSDVCQLARCHADAFAILRHLNLCEGELCQACLAQGQVAQHYGSDWGSIPVVWTLDHQI